MLTTCPSGEVYLQLRPLRPGARPAVVVRDDGDTLVVIDPAATRREMVGWVCEHLTRREMNAYRAAYGQPPVGAPLDEFWLADEPIPTELPAALDLDLPDQQTA